MTVNDLIEELKKQPRWARVLLVHPDGGQASDVIFVGDSLGDVFVSPHDERAIRHKLSNPM